MHIKRLTKCRFVSILTIVVNINFFSFTGKTTTVSLVCKELGFDMVEFNASDTRSKNLIKEQIGELLSTTSLSGYAKGNFLIYLNLTLILGKWINQCDV